MGSKTIRVHTNERFNHEEVMAKILEALGAEESHDEEVISGIAGVPGRIPPMISEDEGHEAVIDLGDGRKFLINLGLKPEYKGKKWEYSEFDRRVGECNPGFYLDLKEKGKQGWELVSTYRESGCINYLFKRELS